MKVGILQAIVIKAGGEQNCMNDSERRRIEALLIAVFPK
jgi:hypothetical protein